MTAFDLDGLDVGLEVLAGVDGGFAVEDLDGRVVGVEAIETMLEQLRLAVGEVDEDGILFVDLVDFDAGAAAFEPDLGVGQIGRDHLHGAVVPEAQKDAGGQQNFCFAVGRGDDLTGLHLGAAYGTAGELAAFYRGLSFYVIKSAWAGWVHVLPILSEDGRAQSRQRENQERFEV